MFTEKNGVEFFNNTNELYAIIVKAKFRESGVNFFTPDNYSQQLAFMKHPRGKLIDPHIHKEVPREIFFTQETLFIRSGKLRVDFFDLNKNYLESRILCEGDAILLIQGGHGFEVLEDVEMFEVKQGPYAGDEDKIRFTANPLIRVGGED